MSQYAKLMLWAAIAVELAYIGFFVAMTDGLNLGTRSPRFLGFAVIGFMAAVAVIIAGQRLFLTAENRPFPDEREGLVDLKSERDGGRFLEAGLFIVIALAIYEASAGPNTLGSFSLTRPEAIVFAMITIAAFASVLRMLLAVVRDQRS